MTPFDQKYLQQGQLLVADLKRRGVLARAESERLNEYNGGALVTCIDANQFGELYGFHTHLSPTGRLGPVTRPGGGLCIPHGSPLSVAQVDGHCIDQRLATFASLDICVHELGIRSVYLYGHHPCKACYLAGMGVREQIDFLVQAKDDLKSRYSTPGKPFVAALMFHVAELRTDGTFSERRTYHVPSKEAARWLKETTDDCQESPP